MASSSSFVVNFLIDLLAGFEGQESVQEIGSDLQRLAEVWTLELEREDQLPELIDALSSLYSPLRNVRLLERKRMIKIECVKRTIRIMQRDAFVLETGNHAPHLAPLSRRISELKAFASREIRSIQPDGPDLQRIRDEYKMFLQSHLTVFGLESLEID